MSGNTKETMDSCWSSVTEETLLLHDDLLRLVDHVPLPSGVGSVSVEEDYGLPVLDGKSPSELAEIIAQECGVKSTTYTSLMEYRLNALRRLWSFIRSKEKKLSDKKSDDSLGVGSSKPQSKGEGFSSRISLVLIFPILHSLSKLDSNLSRETAKILLDSLCGCDPISLSKEPMDCILGLENLLCSWLAAAREGAEPQELQIQTAASALVALAVAVGTGGLLLRTVHMLQSLDSAHSGLSLLVANVLHKLLKEHLNFEEPSIIVNDSHVQCWSYQYQQSSSDEGPPRSILYNGKHVILSTSNGKKILKLGTGICGTIRGYVYTSVDVEKGWLVQCKGHVLYRKKSFDDNPASFCVRLNEELVESGNVTCDMTQPEAHTTLQLLSDGFRLYWVYVLKQQETVPAGAAVNNSSGDKTKYHNVFLQVFDMNIADDSTVSLVPHSSRLLLQKATSDDKGSADMMKALMRAGSTYGSSFSAVLGGTKDDSGTSCGLGLKQLQNSAAYCTGSSLVFITTPPPVAGGRSLFGGMSSSGKSLCVSFVYSLSTGLLVSQADLSPHPQLQCGLNRGGSVITLAASYDPCNHCVWTVCDEWIDVWTCVGRVRPAAHLLATRMGCGTLEELIPTSLAGETIGIQEVISLLLRHSGMESCRLTPGKDFGSPIAHSLSLSFLVHCCDILRTCVSCDQLNDALACVITLQAVIPSFLSSEKYPVADVEKLVDRVRTYCWDLMNKENCPSVILIETHRLISQNCEKLYLSDVEKSQNFLSHLLSNPSPHLLELKEKLFVEVAKELRPLSSLSPSLTKLTELVAQSIERESGLTLEQLREGGANISTTTQPLFTPALQCASAMINAVLRSLWAAASEVKKRKESSASKEETDESREELEKAENQLQMCRDALVNLCQQLRLFELSEKFLDGLCELSCSLSPSESTESNMSADEGEEERDPELTEKRQLLISALESYSKGSILGCILPSLLAVMSDPLLCTLSLTTTFLPDITSLGRKNAECCTLLYADHNSIIIPAPWASGRLIETIHPVRDNYKFKETVSFPGARHLYLKFDSRSSSQYDYDKVQVYAGDSTSSTKVSEYGGNSHGFGSRSVLGKGWPKELVKVDGDTVTFTFEMKSGREHSTPDKAMWGFACTVRPQETADDSPNGLPFLLDLYLSISSICCSLISQLFNGAPPTSDEIKCDSLMESVLLQRCVWPDNDELESEVSHAHREPLKLSTLMKLRELAGKQRPVLRPRISELLQVDLLEDLILSTCLKHKGAESPFTLLAASSLSEENKALLDDIFTRINGLERRIQALAELETRWFADVEEISAETKDISSAFFFDLQQHESTAKQFELLCCLMLVDQFSSMDTFTAAKQLQELMEKDVQRKKDQKDLEIDVHSKTRSLVVGVLDRTRLLLQVNISSSSSTPTPTNVSRSLSVPAHQLGSPTRIINRQRSDGNNVLLVMDTFPEEGEQKLLDEIFQFIGTKPEEAVSCEEFLSAASRQRRRGVDRARALGFLRYVLTSRHLAATVEHLLACVGGVLRNGPCAKDIACSGHVASVREAFADVMHAVVELASNQPAACINTIALLSIIPYTREEEGCLVRSGLVKLLDHLCSMSDLPQGSAGSGGDEGDEEGEAVQRVTTLAWAAFQVLADRCVSWETRSPGIISSGLAQQVSLLLTNHLSRAMETLVTSESGTSDTLQEALSMLLGLARSYMGRTILSQPACVSKLLLLLTDQRPSPKLVLIALQLCRIALPLMTIAECSQVVIPPHPTLSSLPASTNLASKIITLLMIKLAEYITPSRAPVQNAHDATDSPSEEVVSLVHPSQQDEIDESGQASVYIYRRDSESAAEILHLLLNQDPRQLAHRMEAVLRLDQALTDEGKAEILTDSYRACFRRSIRWANMGFTVSIEPPAGSSNEPSGTESDRKKAKAETACKKKNMELLKTDPPRPFLSGTVAYSLASEIIGLLNGLLADPDAAQVWKKAIQDVVRTSLEAVPQSLPKLEHYCTLVHDCVDRCVTPPLFDDHLSSVCLANASFAALGGFKETLRPGMTVNVTGNGISSSTGTICSISEQRGVANVTFEDKYCFGVNKTLEVPLTRLLPPEVGSLPLKQLDLDVHLCGALVSVLMTSPVLVPSPHTGMDAGIEGMGLCRLFAELRTRACMCLAHQVKDAEFKELFLTQCNIERVLKQSEMCSPGQRLSVVESHCLSLRMLYRDCARPPAPKIERPRVERKRFYLDIARSWPVVSYCSFSHHLTSLVYQGSTTSGGSGSEEEGQDKPKGAYIVTNNPIPAHAPSFYWEIEITQLDTGSGAPHLTFGLCPEPKKPAEGEVWVYPEETCLFRSTGRGFQVRGEDRMRWNKLNIENPLKTGDVVGCGWLKEETPTCKGVVYFTVNGTRLEQTFTDAPTELYPFVHVQKKGIRLKLNFGDHCFAYSDGHAHRDAADVNKGDSLEEIIALFKVLPFADIDEEEEEEERKKKEKDQETNSDTQVKPEPLIVGPPCSSLESPPISEVYDAKSAQLCFLRSSFDTMLENGPLVRPGGGTNQEEEEEEDGGDGTHQEEDLHTLLVKSWESKVFPVIQRRFRNDQERKSGLDQIRGALQLGMESIAQETVEFLYEENGGLPRDLHFPTMDDVKADLDKFTINRVKKGSAVVVQKELPYSRCGVRAMQKTQGLTGIVLAVDDINELVQVECYVPSDGALVRFWYPVVYLERPPKGYRKPSALRGSESVSILVHRELLNCEATLTAMYCRSALIALHSLSSSLSFSTYLKFLCQHNFSQPSVEGLCVTTSPSLSPSLISCLSPSVHSLFFSDVTLIERELATWLSNHSGDVLPLVVALNEEACQVGGGNGRGEFPIPEGRESTDVHCSGASFLTVSSVEVKQGSKASASYKYPWAKVFSYRGGQGKAGRMLLQEIIRYPNETLQSAHPQYCGSIFPSHILPTDRLHLKLTGCTPPPGQKLLIHAIPAALPILLTVANSLSIQFDSSGQSANRLSRSLSSCVSPLIKLLCRTDWSPVVREKISHTLSNVLWALASPDHTPSTDHAQFISFPADLLSLLTQELEQLYESECESFVVPTANGGDKAKPKGPPFPPPASIGRGGSGRFSTYFQSLLELVLAAKHYTVTCHAHKETAPTPNGKSAGKKGKHVKKVHWLNYIQRAVNLLLSIARGREIDTDFYRCFYKSMPSCSQSCLLVLTGISSGLNGDVATETISKICSGYGGMAGLYLPLREKTREERGEEERRKLEQEQEKAKAAEKPVVKKEPTSEEAVSDTAERPKPPEKKATPQERPKLKATPTASAEPELVVTGNAVIELHCGAKSSLLSGSLLSSRALQGDKNVLSVLCVSDTLNCGEDDTANAILTTYLTKQLFDETSLKERPRSVLLSIFRSVKTSKIFRQYFENEDSSESSLLKAFLQGSAPNHALKETLSQLWEGKSEESPLTEEEFLKWVEREGLKTPSLIWKGLFAAGYDLQFNRCGFLPSESRVNCSPDSAQDSALALHVDKMCRSLNITSSLLQSWEVTISEAELTATHCVPLQGLSLADIRMRFIALKNINRQLSWLLPLVDLSSTHPHSLGTLLSSMAPFLFYDIKTSFLHAVLNAATRRSLDQAPPEIKMDPLETVGGLSTTVLGTQFCQAACQMLAVPSPQLCVPLASGGDPTYAFNVKLSGEEVHGTSGSFRHFLWQVVRELQSPLLPILIQCPSSAAGINKGKYILATGPMSYSEEKLLVFFGQLLGVALRADVPVALDLLPCFWKGLKGEPLSLEDLKDSDHVTFTMTKNIIEAQDETSFNKLVSHDGETETSSVGTETRSVETETSSVDTRNGDTGLRFIYQSMCGEEEPLVDGGHDKIVTYGNRIEYADAVRQFRMNELSSHERMRAVRCGLASVVPVECLRVLTANDLDLRVCGLPQVDLQYLKIHTTYHVGLMETDKHIQFFWTALESLSQEELRKFIKFACNQERIPFGHPCRGGEVAHVPPYPMKIAPPDGQGPPDSRYIRAETCMFLIKLPQYSSQDIMTERLRYAINCREDPLSG